MGRDAVLTAASISRNGYLMSDIRALGEALEADRVAAVIATPHKMEVVLMDTGLKRAVRRSVVEGDKTMESVERAAAALVARAPGEPVPSDAGGASSETGTQAGMKTLKRPWYRDPSAWVLTLTGAAALGAGIGLMQAYDLESRQAPFAVSLTALGGGLTASGGILFFIRPARSEKSAASRAGVTVGAAVQGAF